MFCKNDKYITHIAFQQLETESLISPVKLGTLGELWKNHNGEILKTTLRPWSYIILRRNPFFISWVFLVVVVIWTAFWNILHTENLLDIPSIDDTVPTLISGSITFFVTFLYSDAAIKRSHNIRNFQFFIRAAVNLVSWSEANLNYKHVPEIKIRTLQFLPYNTTSKYLKTHISCNQCFGEVIHLIVALIIMQRNILHKINPDGKLLTLKRLPLPATLIYEIQNRRFADPLVTIQTMIFHRIKLISKAGGFLESDETMLYNFQKDLIDSLGDILIDATLDQPRVVVLFVWTFIILWILYVPFWVIPLYDGYWPIFASSLSVLFFSSIMILVKRIPNIYVNNKHNTWSDFNLDQSIISGVANIDEMQTQIIQKTKAHQPLNCMSFQS